MGQLRFAPGCGLGALIHTGVLQARRKNRLQDLTAEPQPDDPNGAVRLQVRVRDAKFQPLDNAAVSVAVEPVLFDAAPGAAARTASSNVRCVPLPSAATIS